MLGQSKIRMNKPTMALKYKDIIADISCIDPIEAQCALSTLNPAQALRDLEDLYHPHGLRSWIIGLRLPWLVRLLSAWKFASWREIIIYSVAWYRMFGHSGSFRNIYI